MGTRSSPFLIGYLFLNSTHLDNTHDWNILAYAGCGKFHPINIPIMIIIAAFNIFFSPIINGSIYAKSHKKRKAEAFLFDYLVTRHHPRMAYAAKAAP